MFIFNTRIRKTTLKKKFLLLLLVLQACVLKGQLDSIELQIRIDRISNKEGVATSIIKDYLALLEHYHLTNDQNAVLEYTESALRFAKEKKDTSALIELYSRWINKIWHEGEIETYLKYYREGSQFFKENNLENEYLNIIVNHSIFLAANRSFDESLKLKNNGIELAKKLNNVQVLGSIYYDLGETYLDFSNFSLALLNYNKAINSIGSDPFNWTFYYSISGAIDSYYGIYKETKNPTLIDSMKVNLELLKRPFDEGKIDDFLYQYVINSEIYINVLENRTDQLDLKLKTLEELSRNFSYTPLADAYTTLYDYRILKGDHRKAISYLDKAIELNKSSKPKPSYRELVSNYRKLSDSYRFLGNDKLAYSY